MTLEDADRTVSGMAGFGRRGWMLSDSRGNEGFGDLIQMKTLYLPLAQLDQLDVTSLPVWRDTLRAETHPSSKILNFSPRMSVDSRLVTIIL